MGEGILDETEYIIINDLLTHNLQALAQYPWHHFTKCVLPRNCVLLGVKINNFVSILIF